MRWFSWNALRLRSHSVAALLLAMLALQLAAGVGLAWVAGFGAVREALADLSWPWLVLLFGGLLASLLGYHAVYRGTLHTGPGWSLPQRQLVGVVLAGFGGFVAHGATDVDLAAARAGGADEREAHIHVSALGGLEYGVMAMWGCVAAVGVLVMGLAKPPPSFTLPWAVIPVPGFLLATWLANRYAARLLARPGWRGRLGIFLASIEVVRRLCAHPFSRRPAVLGMLLFWAGDGIAGWAGLALFGTRMNVWSFVVGFATGMVFTRRTGPLASAGIVTVVLPVALWVSGAPLAVAVPGVVVYHVVALWLPLPGIFAAWRGLRELVGTHGPSNLRDAP